MDKYIELFNKTKDIEMKYEIILNMLADTCSDEDIKILIKYNKELRELCATESKKRNRRLEYRNRCIEIYQKTFLVTSHYVFEDYMIYLEINRPYHEQFYRPRMKVLKKVAKALQDLHDDKLDELFLSMPPRVGKSTIVTFYYTWLIGIDSEMTNLYSSCSDTNTHAFYEGVLEIIRDNFTYTFSEIFPNAKVVTTNGKMNILDMDRKKKYPSMTCRSIGGTLNGSCDCNGLLTADDLITGIEEVLNPERMYKIWKLVDNNLLTRAKEKCKILWIGTRWSVIDPVGIRLELLENDEAYKNRKWKVINLPALDENDESNFDYKYGVGFSTRYYKERRASFDRNNDLASWMAQYTGNPIEREGTLFDSGDMKYYNGVLPGEDPIRICSVVDVAWGGGDYVSMPVAYCYEDGSVYIHDVVFNSGEKKITQPLVAKKIALHKIGDVDFEKNNGGSEYKEGVEKELSKIDYKCVMTQHNAPTTKAKELRIFQQAPDIREFYFLESGKRGKEYSMFMNNLFSFKVIGKNKHDDAADSLAMLSERINNNITTQIKIFTRPF